MDSSYRVMDAVLGVGVDFDVFLNLSMSYCTYVAQILYFTSRGSHWSCYEVHGNMSMKSYNNETLPTQYILRFPNALYLIHPALSTAPVKPLGCHEAPRKTAGGVGYISER
jgi:hypothetical protein